MPFATDRLIVRRPSLPADLPALSSPSSATEPTPLLLRRVRRPWTEDEVRLFLAGYPAGDPKLICQPGLVLLKPRLEPVGFGGVGDYTSSSNSANSFVSFRQEVWGAA
jgi:hypothetical protein